MLREFLLYDNFENMPKERYKNLLLQNKKVIDKINRLRERLSFDLYNAANNEYRRIINNFDIPFLRQLMYEQQIDFFEDDYNIKHNILLSKLINHNKMRNLIKLIILKKYSSFIKEDNSISGVLKGIINKLENIKIDEAIKINLIKTFLYLSQKYDINLLGGKMMVGGAENNIYDNILIISVCFYFENDRDMILLCKNLIKKINSNDFSDNLLIKIDDVLASSYKHKILLSSPIVFDKLDYKNIIDEIFNSSDKINRQINDAILLVLTEEISILEQNPEICQPYGILFLLTSLIIEIINRGNLNINIFKKQPIEVLKELYSIVGVAINNTLSEEFIQGLKKLLNAENDITPEIILQNDYIGVELEQPEKELTGVEPAVVNTSAVPVQPIEPDAYAVYSDLSDAPTAPSVESTDVLYVLPPVAQPSVVSQNQSKPSKDLLSKIINTTKYAIPLVLGIASYLWYNKLPISLSTAVSDISNLSSVANISAVSSVANISAASSYSMMPMGTTSPYVYTTNQSVIYTPSFPLSLTNSPVFGPELAPIPSNAAKNFASTLQHYLDLSSDLQSLFKYTNTYMVKWNNNTYNVGFIRLQTDGKGTNLPSLIQIPILFKPSKIVQRTDQIIEPAAVNTQIIYSSDNPQNMGETTCPYVFAPGSAVQIFEPNIGQTMPLSASSTEYHGTVIPNFVLDTSNLISYSKNFTSLQEQSLNPESISQDRFLQSNVFIKKEQINFDTFEKTSFNNDTYKTTLKFNDTEVIYFDKLDRTKDVITALGPYNITKDDITALGPSNITKDDITALGPSNITTALENISQVEQQQPWMIELYYNTSERLLLRPTEGTGALSNEDSSKTYTSNNPISQSGENVELSQSGEIVEQSQLHEKEKPPRGCVESRTPDGIITQNIVLCGEKMTPQQKELNNCLENATLERDSSGNIVVKDKNGVRVVCTSYKKKYTKYYKKYLKYKTKYLKLEN
jgi:hypothetical protein